MSVAFLRANFTAWRGAFGETSESGMQTASKHLIETDKRHTDSIIIHCTARRLPAGIESFHEFGTTLRRTTILGNFRALSGYYGW